MKRLFSSSAILLAFVGVALLPAANVAFGQVVCNKFKLVTELTGDTLHLAVDTDLPDSTVIAVSVSRLYFKKGKPDAYVQAYFGENGTVGKWKSAQTVTLDNETWKKRLRKRQEQMSRRGYGFDVASVSDKINVQMIVPLVQPDPRFGQANSELTGAALKTASRTVEDEVEIPYPLDNPPVGKSPFPNPISPLELENNQTYVVSKRTPLMPSPNPANPLAALRKMQYIPEGGSFKVLSKWEQKGNPWYKVTAFDQHGEAMGRGWINSAALLGQKLKAHR